MDESTLTIAGVLAQAATQLGEYSPTARLDAELLLAHGLGIGRAGLLARRNDILAVEAYQTYQCLLERRMQREPVAYILGEREFYGLRFVVDPRVLIPRPETELLVELALAQASPNARILDLCTGSGCIAIALATHLPQAQITATDLSPDALDVARNNVERHQLAARITLSQGDLFAAATGRFDMIVSNPPYTILDRIEVGVYQHEPHLALDGGHDGLALYRRIFAVIPDYLAMCGTILLEIGADQGQAVAILAQHAFPGARVTIHRDLAGWDRVVEVHVDCG